MADAPPMSLMTIVDESIPAFVLLDEKHLCVLCHKALRSPVQTTCGHRMCRVCLERLFEDQPEGSSMLCPAKEEGCEMLTKDEIYPDFSAQRELQQQKVYCKNKDLGCPATVPWKKLKAHMETCAYFGKPCPYKDFGCEKKIPLKQFDQHIYNECEFIPTECQFCKVNVPKKIMKEHEEKGCNKAPIPCPHMCGETTTREKLSEHETRCRLRPHECKYKGIGCPFKGSQSEVNKHHQAAAPTHVDLLSASHNRQASQIEGLTSQLQEVHTARERLKETCETLKSEQENLKQKVNAQETKIRTLQRSAATQAEKVAKLEEANTTYAKEVEVRKQEREIIHMKDKQSNLEGQIRSLEHSTGGATGIPADMRQKIMTYDRQMGIHDVRLAEMDLRFQCLETSSYNGVLIWKVTEYQRRKDEAKAGRTLSLYSQPFFSSRYGYKMCGRVYLNGDGAGKNTHMSLFFVVMRGEYDNLMPWPFRCKVTLTLLDQTGGDRHCSDTFRPDPTSTSFRKPVSEMNIASGCPCFVPHTTIERSPFLVNDTLYIKVTVDSSNIETL